MGVSNVASLAANVTDGIKAQARSLNDSFKTLAIRFGSLLINRNGWQNVIIESDSFTTIKMIREKMVDYNCGRTLFPIHLTVLLFVSNMFFAPGTKLLIG